MSSMVRALDAVVVRCFTSSYRAWRSASPGCATDVKKGVSSCWTARASVFTAC